MIINKLELNLKRCGITPTIDAAQGDILSRGLELSLFDGTKPYALPENLAVLIRYKKADGKGGEYDTMPDGSPAWSAKGNTLTILLTHQMFTFPGNVSMTITLVSGGTQISTFPVQINVLPEAKALSANSEDYFNVTGFLVAPGSAETGQFLKVKAINSEGRVTQIEADTISQEPSDWDAAEGTPGHILNRPFYSDYTHQLLLPETVPMYLPGDGLFICDDSVTPAPGTECTVTWNGTEYRCTVQDLSALGMTDVIGIGALDLALSEEGLTGNHEPFAIISGPAHIMAQMGANTIIIALDGSTELTLAIQGIVEAVTLIPQKYLKNARGQKKYTMNLDNGSVDVSVETLMEMDAAEIQSSLTIIYKGHPHNVSIIEMNSEMVGDKPYCWIVFAVDSGYGERTYFQYHNIGGLSLRRTSYDVQYHFSDRLCLYGKPTYENQPVWLELENTPFPGILLSSSTLGSSKKFWITVDDSGTLTVTQK